MRSPSRAWMETWLILGNELKADRQHQRNGDQWDPANGLRLRGNTPVPRDSWQSEQKGLFPWGWSSRACEGSQLTDKTPRVL